MKLKDLSELAASDDLKALYQRLDAIILAQSTMNVMLLDADSEEYGRSATPITGLSDIHERYQARLSHAARIPQTVLFGQAPSGLDATGESDIRLYYDRISAMRRFEVAQDVKKLATLCLRAKGSPVAGKDIKFDVFWPALWEATALERAQTRKHQAEADFILTQIGAFTAAEIRETRSEDSSLTEIRPIPRYTSQIEDLSEAKLQQAFDSATMTQPDAEGVETTGTEPQTDKDGSQKKPVAPLAGGLAHPKSEDQPRTSPVVRKESAGRRAVAKSGVSEQIQHKISGQ